MRFNANLSAGVALPSFASARPGVPQGELISRYMGARKRAWKSPERRTFPQFYPGMSTARYVREFYRLNGLYNDQRGTNAMGYPDSYIAPIDRPAPVLVEDQPELLAEEVLA